MKLVPNVTNEITGEVKYYPFINCITRRKACVHARTRERLEYEVFEFVQSALCHYNIIIILSIFECTRVVLQNFAYFWRDPF